MIYVKFFKDKSHIFGFEIKGHSNFYRNFFNRFLRLLKIVKKDYICAAVSSAAYMTVIGISKVLKKRVELIDNDGYMKFSVKNGNNKDVEKFFQTFRLTLLNIEKEYSGNINVVIVRKSRKS